MLLIVPSDPLAPRRPDEHFAREASAAREVGVSVALVDHDALTGGDVEAAVSRVPADDDAVYRGWMLSAAAYRSFEAALQQRGCRLRTSSEQYARAHEFPGWYPTLADHTPASTWTDGDARAAFEEQRRALGADALVLRDYVKSAKHYWDTAAYVPDAHDADAAWAIASELRRLREDDFTGGFVLRTFESFEGAEVRTWWVDGRCVLVTAHPDTPHDLAEVDSSFLADAIGALDAPFVTADLARRTDGVWRVVEVGDGQVSDRPAGTDPADLIRAVSNRG